MARFTAAFDHRTVEAGTGAVSMSQREEPSSDTDAAVVDEMLQKKARPHGSTSPMTGTSSGGSRSSDSAPVSVPAATAIAAISTSTYPMQAFMK